MNPTILAQGHFAGPSLSYYPTFNAFGGKFPGLPRAGRTGAQSAHAMGGHAGSVLGQM